MPAVLEVRGLKKYFPVTEGLFRSQVALIKALDGIDLTVHQGEVVAIVGESGCGKSTLGRAAIGLIEPTAGEVYFEGRNLLTLPINEMKSFRKDFQMIFQDPYASLNPRKTVGETLTEPLLFHSLAQTRDESYDIAKEVLALVGLPADALNRYPHQFSGGQQQRICIGRAIALKPKLIICDEAVSALDISVQAQILNLLVELKQALNLSYLFISHDLSVVRHIADTVIVLYLGKMMETAPVDELFNSPKHPYTQALLSAIPSRHPQEKKNRLLLTGEIPSPRSPPSGCPFRTRCPLAKDICQLPPPLKQFGRHSYACIL